MIHEYTRVQLAEIRHLLRQLSDEQLSEPLEVLNGSSLGMHLRHILEFYHCLFNALEEGKLDYDQRARNKEIECSVASGLNCVRELLRQLDRYSTDLPLTLYANCSRIDEGETMRLTTTYFRELFYNIEHCVHHMAIIKIGVNSINDGSLLIDETVGVAASTLRNKNQCAQ